MELPTTQAVVEHPPADIPQPESQHSATTEAESMLPEWTSDESQPITTTESESTLPELESPDSERTMKELAEVEPPPKLRRMTKHLGDAVFPRVVPGQLQGQY
jgi:hypothetical protein